jgi:uncharacterized membrane protein
MSELVVIGFKKDLYRAAAVLSELRERDDAWTANLHSSIAAYRNPGGELTIDQSYESTEGESTIVGGMLGSLLGIALAALTLPLTGGASAVVAAAPFVAGAIGGSIVGAHHGHGDASWWKTELGVSDSFLQAIRDLVQPGDSAILFLLRKPDPDDLQERFRPYGGTVIRSALTATQTATLQARLTGKSRS